MTETARRLIDFTIEQSSFFDRDLRPETDVVSYRIHGPLALDVVKRALAVVIARHAALRARVATSATTVTQTFAAPSERHPVLVEPVASAAAATAAAAARIAEPLDVERDGPLVALLHPIAEDDSFLTVAIGHPWSDAWSLGIVDEELWAAYRWLVGHGPPLPPVVHDITTRLARQQAAGTPSIRQRAHFLAQLEPLANPAWLVPRRDPRASVMAFDPWPDEFVERASQVASRAQVTLPILAMAAMAAAIAQSFASPTMTAMASLTTRDLAGQQKREVGYCQALAPVRMDVDPGSSVGDLARTARTWLVNLLVHARPPYAYAPMLRNLAGESRAAADLLRLWRSGGPEPKAFVPMFNPVMAEEPPAVRTLAPGLVIERIDLVPDYSPCALFDIMFVPQLGPAKAGLRLHYDPAQLTLERVRALAQATATFLTAEPTSIVGELDLAVADT